MTFNECRDLILLRVNGGKMNTDSAVQRADVEAYLPAVISKVVADDLKEKMLLAGRMRSASISFAAISNYFKEYSLTVTKDTNHTFYATLPGTVFQMGMIEAVESVIAFNTKGALNYIRVSGKGAVFSMGEAAKLTPMFWLENGENGTVVRMNKVPKSCDINVRALLVPSCDRGDEEMPCEDSLQARVIAVCVEHFRGQRNEPADVMVSNHDVNAAVKE